MSHEIKGQIEVKDLEAFAAAVKEIGGCFHQGQRTYTMYQGKQPCDHAASFPGVNYQVGLRANPEKRDTFDPVWDTYGNGRTGLDGRVHDGQKLVERCGEQMGRLKQAYGLQVAERTARRKGHRTRRVQKAGGTVQLVIGG